MTTTGPSAVISSATAASDGDRQRALALLRRHGWNATSFQILEPGFLYWFDDRRRRRGRSLRRLPRHRAAPGWRPARRSPGRSARPRSPSGSSPPPPRTGGGPASSAPRIGSRRRRRSRPCASASRPDWDPVAWDETLRGTRSLREQIRRVARQGGHRAPVRPAPLRRAGRRAARQRRPSDRALGGGASDAADGVPGPDAPSHRARGAALLRRHAGGRRWSASSAWCRCSRGAAGSSRIWCGRPRRPTAPPSCWSTRRCAPRPPKGAAT